MTPDLSRSECAAMAPSASASGTGPNFIVCSGGDAFGLAAAAKRRDDLREDGDGDLGRRLRADVDADRRVDALDVGGGGALRDQPLDALAVRLPAAERADIERARRERREDRDDRRSSGRG